MSARWAPSPNIVDGLVISHTDCVYHSLLQGMSVSLDADVLHTLLQDRSVIWDADISTKESQLPSADIVDELDIS